MLRRILFLLLVSVCVSAYPKGAVSVFITAGQSNTDGRIYNKFLPEYIKKNKYQHTYWCFNSGKYSMNGKFEPFWPRIEMKGSGRWAYDAVTYYWLDQSMGEDYYVIKESLGGTAIDTSCLSRYKMYWSASPEFLNFTAATDQGGKSLLKALCENIDRAIDESLSKLKGGFEFKAFLWHQGESDLKAQDRYYDNLKAVIAYLRQHLVSKTGNKKYAKLPVLLGGISHKSRGYSKGVEDAQKRLQDEDPNIYLVMVDQTNMQEDNIHFDAAGGELLGKKMYNQLVKLKLAGKKAKCIQVHENKAK